jgi:predicted RecB family nuclease
MSKLSLIEGIGESYELKLEAAGVKSIEGLLEACATKKAGLNWQKKLVFPKN